MSVAICVGSIFVIYFGFIALEAWYEGYKRKKAGLPERRSFISRM